MRAIEFDEVSKLYRLGNVGLGTLSHDLNRWWQVKVMHREDPYSMLSMKGGAKVVNDNLVWALRNVSFSVDHGEVVGIIGKNGSGKSTLLKILSKITTPTTGSIRVHGRVASLLEVGTGFHPELTGRENVYMNGTIIGMTKSEIDRKLDEIVDFSGIEQYIDTPVKRYSSGMKVRLGFSVAAHLEPEILVVDEVLAVGDLEFQQKALGKMQNVSAGDGRTVLFVSHNMAAVRKLCGRGIVLNEGQMLCDQPMEEAIEQYMELCSRGNSNLVLTDLPKDARGAEDFSVERFEILNEEGVPANPRSGKMMRVRIKIKTATPYRRVTVTVTVRDRFGNPMLAFPIYLTQDEFPVSAGEHVFELVVPKLPLTVGDYMLGFFAKADRVFLYGRTDLVRITVDDDDFFDNGRRVPRRFNGNVVLCEHQWKID